MAFQNSLQIGDPVLRETAESVRLPVDELLKDTLSDLKDTMRAENLVGLAAPQIGKSIRIIVTEIRPDNWRKLPSDDFRAYINPQIVAVSRETAVDYEGCGSIARGQLFGLVERAKDITLQYTDELSVSREKQFSGLLARVIQHEIDHLNGILFTDLANPDSLIDRQYFMDKLSE